MDFTTYVTAQKDHNQAMSDQLNDIAGDVKNLSDQIAALKAAPGTLTADQQTILDQLNSDSVNLVQKATDLANVTPPVAPVANGGVAG